MFHKQYNFVGRTYCSFPHSLRQSGNEFYSDINDYLLFYTNFPMDSIFLIVEFIVIELSTSKEQIPSSAFSIGWSVLTISNDRALLGSDLLDGTPRFLQVAGYQSI